jgi:hypothetical protein
MFAAPSVSARRAGASATGVAASITLMSASSVSGMEAVAGKKGGARGGSGGGCCFVVPSMAGSEGAVPGRGEGHGAVLVGPAVLGWGGVGSGPEDAAPCWRADWVGAVTVLAGSAGVGTGCVAFRAIGSGP